MNIGGKIKAYREMQQLSQEELASKIFVSRQTISNWENNKSCPDIRSLSLLGNVFHVTLDELVRDDIKEMKETLTEVDEREIKKFNLLGYLYFTELILMVVGAYPLFKFLGTAGFILWLILTAAACVTAFFIEKIKKRNHIWTYKEIVAFTEKRPLTHDETQQELGKRPYQKILCVILAAAVAFIVCLATIFIFGKPR